MEATTRGVNPLFLRDEVLDRALGLMLTGHRTLWEPRGRGGATMMEPRLHRALFVLARQGPVPVTRLGRVLGLSKPTMLRQAALWEAAGWISLTTSETDRRVRLAAASEAGRAAERQASQVLTKRLARAFRAAGADAVAGFLAVLDRLAEEAPRG